MFLLRTLRQTAGLEPRRTERRRARTLPPRQNRQEQARRLSSSAARKCCGIPDSYVLGIVPASDTGAVEMALWSMLGERGVDVLAWESFSSGWAADCKNQLHLKDLRVFKANYGELRRPQSSGLGPRRRLRLERNHLRRASSQRRLDCRRSRRPRHLRRHLRRLRHGHSVGQARRRHLVLAKSAGR